MPGEQVISRRVLGGVIVLCFPHGRSPQPDQALVPFLPSFMLIHYSLLELLQDPIMIEPDVRKPRVDKPQEKPALHLHYAHSVANLHSST
jgi:hypothetical protein